MSDQVNNPVKEEILTTIAILIQISLLLIILFTSYILQRNKVKFIHETVLSIVLGKSIQDILTFDHRYFFNLLLPPIILNSGYDMKRQNFFKNFGVILVFAFLGTFISTLIIGFVVYLFALTGIHHLKINLLDCLVFGAILSSTDPVTVLAIFNHLKVDPKLYAIIFGESILNDSVAIVLFGTLGRFQGKSVTFANLVSGILSFISVLFGSVVIGIIMSLICAILLKRTRLHEHPSLESCIIILIAYASYLFSNAIQLSGIVSLLFCGITLKHYAYDNMSVRSRRTTKYMIRVLSHLSENFIFIYLGITLFTKDDESYYPGLIFLSLILIMAARYATVIPLANLINWTQRKLYGRSELIPKNHQLMIWWSGLRGAISFALASDVVGEAGPAIRTTTLFVCVVSIMVLGSTTNIALQKLNIETGVQSLPIRDPDDEAIDSSDDGTGDWDDDLPGSLRRNAHFVRPFSLSNRSSFHLTGDDESISSREAGNEQNSLIRSHSASSVRPQKKHWFIGFDEKYLKPIFTRRRKETIHTSNSRRRYLSLSPDHAMPLHPNIQPSSSTSSYFPAPPRTQRASSSSYPVSNEFDFTSHVDGTVDDHYGIDAISASATVPSSKHTPKPILRILDESRNADLPHASSFENNLDVLMTPLKNIPSKQSTSEVGDENNGAHTTQSEDENDENLSLAKLAGLE